MKTLTLFLLLVFSALLHAQSHYIYVSDAGNFNNPPWQILRFDANGQNPVQFIGNFLDWPQDILFLEDQNEVLISNLGSGCINRHNASTGAYLGNFACQIGQPTRIKVGPDGLLYVLQWSGNGLVKRYQLNGSFVDDYTSVSVPQSIGLDWDVDGNLYVSSYNGDLVRKFDTAGQDLGIFINSNLQGPTNIWFDNNGDLLVIDYDGTAVKRFDSTGQYVSDFMGGLSQAEGIAIQSNGNYLIGNGASSSVKMFDSTGTFIQDLIPSGSGNLLNPNAVVLRTVDDISTHSFNPRVYFIHPTTGTQFNIKKDNFSEIERITVHGSDGKQVEWVGEVSQGLIDLQSQADGHYIITLFFKNGSQSKERVLKQE